MRVTLGRSLVLFVAGVSVAAAVVTGFASRGEAAAQVAPSNTAPPVIDGTPAINEILAASRARMKQKGIDGTIYCHPTGLHGHGAGPLIGLWDYQDGVPGRGDAKVIPSMWWSIELQATTPVAEWGNQAVRMAQEEDAIIGPDGAVRWALRRQDALFLVR